MDKHTELQWIIQETRRLLTNAQQDDPEEAELRRLVDELDEVEQLLRKLRSLEEDEDK